MILSENRIENLLLLLLTVDDQHQLLLPIKWFFQNLKLAAQKRFLNTKLSLLRIQEKEIEGRSHLEIVTLSPLQPSCNSCLGGPGMRRLFSL